MTAEICIIPRTPGGIADLSISQDFEQSIRCGTGAAYRILQANPEKDFSHAITRVALNNYAYDPQCEGHRSEYILGLISLCRNKERIKENVLSALAADKIDSHDLIQLYELASAFAIEGTPNARELIYTRFQKDAAGQDAYCGVEAILKMDRLEGLLFIAENRGKALEDSSDDWEDTCAIDALEAIDRSIPVYEELEKASRRNRHIRKYVYEIRHHEQRSAHRQPRPECTYASIKESIKAKRIYPGGDVRTLKRADVERLAEDFLNEEEQETRERYLRIFSRIEFPYSYEPLIAIASGPNNRTSPNFRIVRFACKALSFFQSDDIRQFAIQKLSTTNIPSDYIVLLKKNYKEGDGALLARIADRYKNDQIVHELASSYIEVYNANETKECRDSFEILYKKLTCGLCRKDLLYLLFRSGVLSKKIVAEMKYDSLLETREFFEQIEHGLSRKPEEPRQVLSSIFSQLKSIRPEGWSIVKGQEKIIIRPLDRRIGKFVIEQSPTSIVPRYSLRFYSEPLGQWDGIISINHDRLNPDSIISWMTDIEKRELSNDGLPNTP